MLSVLRKQIDKGEENFSSEGFRNIVENHLQYFTVKNSTTITLELHDEYMYIGDFFGLLTKLKINSSMHWIIMRVNGLHSPIDYDGNLQRLILPQQSFLKLLLSRYLNSFSLN